ncbi:related to transcriptional repressor rco-1 [Cephalotrichum gorgonifer]|uniref:Related to transcriptional repressor rco-1 n=1 Tax=Cephalotrichum gorgonifer TaxID=2041049 RepID=A0AAE8N1Y4_9PEZI|nr:related to transcriptional repressor rco-1 [Cephalotrichum gorgonifer]
MSASTDPQRFFESDAFIEKRERRAAKSGNKFGNPIVLKSKILAAVVDPSSPSTSILVAEAAGKVRRVNLETSTVTRTYNGPTTPISCLTVGGQTNNVVYAGSWDKTVWSWDLLTGEPLLRFKGHSDFVKALLWTRISGIDVLISGSADKKIIVWDANTGARLHTIQDPAAIMMSIQDLVLDPVLSTPDEAVVLSASSDPHIRRWRITKDSYEQLSEIDPDLSGAERSTIREHETSVYKLVFEDGDEEGDLWTASADGSAKCLSRAKHFTTEDEFVHGDYLRGVVPTGTWVVTAGRDEDVKVWDRSSGKLYCVLVGHFDEITDLVLLEDPKGLRHRVCSVSIDGTIRTWPLAREELDTVVKEIQEASARQLGEEKKEDANGESGMTAEEEAELAALMED